MVNGMESFRTKFIDYPDCYTVIGGAACDILMSEADVPFRATKDIDMILLLEDRYQDFAKVFWEYIKEGGYRCGWKNSKDVHFYRFTDPVPGYPVQIELFSRFPDYHLRTDSGIIPIHINDDISSLSAILLNDDFYGFMMQGRRNIDGISVLDASYLIPFMKKHKYDVFRLLEIVTPDETVKVIGMVKDSINAFLDRIQEEELPLAQIGLSINKDQSIQQIQNLYKQ